MGTCKLDHSVEDVRKKLQEQQSYLPESIVNKLETFLNEQVDQQMLNELFHLLKKYDLASPDEQATRNDAFLNLLA